MVGGRDAQEAAFIISEQKGVLAALSSSSLLLSSLELSDTKVYEPQIRARLGTAAHFLRILRRGAQAMFKRGAKSMSLKYEPS